MNLKYLIITKNLKYVEFFHGALSSSSKMKFVRKINRVLMIGQRFTSRVFKNDRYWERVKPVSFPDSKIISMFQELKRSKKTILFQE